MLPVGHFAGPMFIAPDAVEPESYEVRYEDGVFSLSAAEYAVWALAHGDPDRVGSHRPTRQALTAEAEATGVTEPAVTIDALISDGLLALIEDEPAARRAFAERHQLMPLALGLGNQPSQLGVFQIGMPNTPRVSVGYDIYHMWLFCHRERTLWAAVQEIAGEAQEANDAAPAGDVELIADVDDLLAGLIEALPILLSTSCGFLDPRRPSPTSAPADDAAGSGDDGRGEDPAEDHEHGGDALVAQP
ncbi:MAG: hypothetical protein HOV79_29690 [Hamadaea sp.]|nr:hypothetical protein [Hamadaea sp.]